MACVLTAGLAGGVAIDEEYLIECSVVGNAPDYKVPPYQRPFERQCTLIHVNITAIHADSRQFMPFNAD